MLLRVMMILSWYLLLGSTLLSSFFTWLSCNKMERERRKKRKWKNRKSAQQSSAFGLFFTCVPSPFQHARFHAFWELCDWFVLPPKIADTPPRVQSHENFKWLTWALNFARKWLAIDPWHLHKIKFWKSVTPYRPLQIFQQTSRRALYKCTMLKARGELL